MSSNNRSDSPDSGGRATPEEILELLPDLVFELSMDGHYLEYHAGPRSELYAPPDEFRNKHFSDVLPTPVAEKFEDGLQKLSDTGEPTEVSYVLPVDGGLEFFECRFVALDDDRAVALVRNMSDTWRTKTELQQSEARFRTLVNNIPGLVYRCLTDEAWTALYISPSVEEMFGYRPDAFIARNTSLQSLIHPEDRNQVRRSVLEAIERREPFYLSYRMIDADDDVRHVTERGQAVYSDNDEVEYLDGVIFDVTDLHRMRQRLFVTSKMAAVGSLAAGVAHEVNNPLAIVLANLELLDEKRDDFIDIYGDDSRFADDLAEIEEAIDKIRNSVERVRDITDTLRTFTDAAESRADHIDLQRLVHWAIDRMGRRVDSDSCIEIDLAEVPPIWASEMGVVEVVWQLLDNALDAISHRDDEGGRIAVDLTHDDDRVYLDVQDNGPGMAPEVLTRAFDPFYTTKQVGQGTGLGLFVSQGLVEGMDGRLELDSTPGEGTRVTISFPTYELSHESAADTAN